MLQKLFISNYALIDSLEFYPSKEFTVITGETGAGKSIILGALGLLLGNRSEGTDLFQGDKKSVLEAEFNGRSNGVKEFLKSNDFDLTDVLYLRRELLPSGKTRAFINDTPANLNQLKKLGNLLLDIHAQHGHLDLKDGSKQLQILDEYSNNRQLLLNYKEHFKDFVSLQQRLKTLKEEQNRLELDRDYNEFLFNELHELNPVDGELDELQSELSTLQHAEEIQEAISNSQNALNEEGGKILGNLQSIESLLNPVSDFSSELKEVLRRFHEARIELEDLSQELDSLEPSLDFDPERIQYCTSRVDSYNALLHKHRLTIPSELIAKKEELELKLSETNSMHEAIVACENELNVVEQKLHELSLELRKLRLGNKSQLERELQLLLIDLGIKEAQIEFKLEQLETLTSTGMDRISLLFSANKGKKVKEILKVASGGELSRTMLAVKYILSQKVELPTIVFDEIDTGVSGEVADKMGDIMKAMSKHMQVISITHLPQVAAKGSVHFQVSKLVEQEKSVTQLKQISGEDRVFELAKMLSGENISSVAKENARILLNN